MSEPDSVRPSVRSAWTWRIAAAVAAVLVMAGLGAGVFHARQAAQQTRLLTTLPDEVPGHPDLVRLATAQGRSLFARNCASCHGADMKGQAATGAPDLTDGVWLYGEGDVFSIERTILYGVRSGQEKSHDITEMPAFGLRGQLSQTDIDNVVQYMLQLSNRPHDVQAADLGREVYNGPSTCFDCHGSDARGNSDYGAPDLTANVWVYGGDPRSLYNSVYYGRHGVMPAWYGKLTLEQIRALAVYIYAVSHH